MPTASASASFPSYAATRKFLERTYADPDRAQKKREKVRSVLVRTLVGFVLTLPLQAELALNGTAHWDASTGGWDFARRTLTFAHEETGDDLLVLASTPGSGGLSRAQRYGMAAANLEKADPAGARRLRERARRL